MTRFDEDVDTWVLAAMRAGPTSFDDVVCHLPGVYPTEVVEALSRLHERGGISRSEHEWALSRRHARSSPTPNTALPLPHPLDFDWRFAPEALDQIIATCPHAIDANLACLGAPSVLHRLGTEGGPAATLLDANPAIIEALSGIDCRHIARLCRLAVDPLPDTTFDAVIIDPPWYPEHFRLFLWAASRLSCDGGRVLASFPQAGTRSGVTAERYHALDYAEQVGLSLVEIKWGSLPYLSPPFEQASLAAAGWPKLPSDWRRGDLLVLEAQAGRHLARAPAPPAEDLGWTEVPASKTRLKVRNARRRDPDRPVAPPLRQIVEGDVLPTVSRRDPRRDDVALWSATNRVFACDDPATLTEVIRARAAGISAVDVVAGAVRRSLGPDEADKVRCTVRQLDQLIETEIADLAALGWKD
jgi:hypothetical protein